MYFAVVHPEKRCSTDSFSIQKGTDLTSFTICFCEVFLSKDSVLKQKPHKDFVRARCSFSWLWLQLLEFIVNHSYRASATASAAEHYQILGGFWPAKYV
jgi:hypothetical protein